VGETTTGRLPVGLITARGVPSSVPSSFSMTVLGSSLDFGLKLKFKTCYCLQCRLPAPEPYASPVPAVFKTCPDPSAWTRLDGSAPKAPMRAQRNRQQLGNVLLSDPNHNTLPKIFNLCSLGTFQIGVHQCSKTFTH